MPNVVRCAILAFLTSSAAVSAQSTPSPAFLAQVAQSGAVVKLVTAFLGAQREFDLATIRALTDDDYVEISPLDDVDPRDKVLGFYTPDKKVAAPAMTIGETTVRSR